MFLAYLLIEVNMTICEWT